MLSFGPANQLSAPPPNPIATAVAVPNRGRIPRDYTPSYVPPPYGYPPVRFQCPYCAYWARTTLVPLMVLAALKPRAKNDSGAGINELFLQEPHSIGMTPKAPHQSWGWFLLFRGLDGVLRAIEPLFPLQAI